MNQPFDMDNMEIQAGLSGLASDEEIEAEIRKDMDADEAARNRKILDELGIDEEQRRTYFQEPEPELSREELLEQTRRKEITYEEEAVRSAKKLLDSGEYPGLSIDDPALRIWGLKLRASKPNLPPVQLARQACELASDYKGLGPARAQKRNKDYVSFREAHQARIKAGSKQWQKDFDEAGESDAMGEAARRRQMVQARKGGRKRNG